MSVRHGLGVALAVSLLVLAACAPPGEYGVADRGGDAGEPQATGHVPVGVDLLYTFENLRTEVYYPLEGLAGLAWGDDGTLVLCDEARGKVHALDPRTRTWSEFDFPGARPYRPVDAVVDGFKVLVLDVGGQAIYRFDLNGVYQDRIVDFRNLDPAYDTVPSAFDVDLDGRLFVCDAGEQQIVLLDSFLALQSRVGGPGPHREQFSEPSGICFLPDGGFMVSDRGNRRLQRFNRLGYWEATIGGSFDPQNPFVAPQGTACDRWGNVFVADAASGVIHVLDRRGRLILEIGPDESLQGTPLGPVDVALGPDRQLAVSDRLRGAVLVFRILYD